MRLRCNLNLEIHRTEFAGPTVVWSVRGWRRISFTVVYSIVQAHQCVGEGVSSGPAGSLEREGDVGTLSRLNRAAQPVHGPTGTGVAGLVDPTHHQAHRRGAGG